MLAALDSSFVEEVKNLKVEEEFRFLLQKYPHPLVPILSTSTEHFFEDSFRLYSL